MRSWRRRGCWPWGRRTWSFRPSGQKHGFPLRIGDGESRHPSPPPGPASVRGRPDRPGLRSRPGEQRPSASPARPWRRPRPLTREEWEPGSVEGSASLARSLWTLQPPEPVVVPAAISPGPLVSSWAGEPRAEGRRRVPSASPPTKRSCWTRMTCMPSRSALGAH